MVQGKGTNPQVGKVTVEEFARRIKEKYPQYIDVDDLELTQRIIDKYPQYKNTVSFEPPAVKKKDAAIPSAPLDGASPSQKSKEFIVEDGVKRPKVTVGDWWGDKWNGLVEGVSDFMYSFRTQNNMNGAKIASFIEEKKDKHPEFYNLYQQKLQESSDFYKQRGYSDDMIRSTIANSAYVDYWQDHKEIENELVPFIRQKGREEDVADVGIDIDKAVQKELDKRFLSTSIKGLAASIPAMVTSASTLGGSFVTTAYYQADEELKRNLAENPNLEMSKAQQEAYKVTIGGMMGVLERIGLSRAIKGTPIVKDILGKKVFTRLAGMGGDVTSEAFERVVKEEVKGLKGYVSKTAGGSLAEFETGALQQLFQDVTNEFVNAATGQQIFTPKTAMQIIEDTFYAGAQEAVGGGIISGTVGALSRPDITTIEDFEKAETLIKGINQGELEIDIKRRVRLGEITQEQGDNILKSAKEFSEAYNKLPDNLSQQDKVEMYRLINKKLKLRQSVEGKDEAIQRRVNKDISLIDDQIVSLYEKSQAKIDTAVEPVKTEQKIAEPTTEEAIEALNEEGIILTEETIANKKKEMFVLRQAEAQAEPAELQFTDQYNEDEVAVADVDTSSTAENSRAETERVKQSPIEEEDGTTLNLDGTTYEGDGLVVPFASDDFKSEEVTPELIAEFVENNKNKIPKGAKVVVGLYSFKGEDKVSIDLSVVVDEGNLAVATEFARLMGQKSIYRISDGQTVSTGETGDNTVTLMDARARQAAIAITQGKLPQYLKGISSPSEMAAYKADQEKAYKKSQEKPKKQEYVDVKDLGKDDRTPERFTDKRVKKLQSMVDNFNKVIKRIGAKPYNITFVANNEQYEARYRELTGKDKSANRGTFIGSKREIIINLSSANEGTLAHEMMHAYLHALNITGKNILQLTNALYTELSTGSAIEKQIARELRKFQDEYIRRNIYGKNKTLEDPNIAEEFLTEYVGIMVQYSERVSASGKVSFAEKIRRAVLKFLTKLGIKDKSILQAIETREEAVNFINGFVNVLSDRAGIETLPTIDVKIQETADPYRAQRSEMEQIEAPAGSRLFNNPLKEATDLSRSYMDSKGLEYKEGKPFNTIDEKQAKRISDAFDAMKDDPTNPEVAAAYKALAEETIDQFEFIIKAGYNVEINNNEPYSSSGEMIEDLRTNKRMKIFSTESGFGDEKITEKQRKENPLLQRTKYKDVNGEPLLVNDLFRFVHDFFGHAKRGNGFGAKGEENAWDVHSRMYSPQARRAMTSETRGQNSYVNFSGINDEAFALRDKARKLRKEGKTEEAAELVGKVYEIMKFADQKVGLLPDEFVENPYDNAPTLQEVSEDGEAVSKEQIDAIKIISLETPRQKAKKDAVADLLNGFSESQLDPNSSEQDLISRFLSNIFEESSYTLKKGARESGMTWYIEDITEFENKMKVLLPELNDPNQMKLFKQVLAITSSGTNPNQNLQTAYTLWVRSNGNAVNFAKNWGEDKISFISKKKKAIGTGIIVRETKTKYIVQKVDALGNLETFKNGQPKLFEARKSELKAGYPKPAGFTSRGSIVAQQLKKIEKIYKDVDGDINKLIEFFEKPQPVSQLRKYNDKVPDVDGNVRKVAVGKRNGAFIFGEKIGAFYQNMIGIGDTITMDLWWSRTWNRYMGTMLSTVKGKEVIQETPRTDRERDIMRKAVTIAAKKLNLDVSELQAVIWYFEQELWTKAGSKSPSFSYVTAVEALNSKIKTDEQTQKRFSEAGADLTAAEKRRQDAIARADNIIAPGGIQGDVDSKEQIDFAGIEMKVKETPGNTDPAIKTGGMAYVPVSKLYNLMDMRDGDRGGLYETARDKKRVAEIVERFKKEGFNSTDGWYQTIYVDIDAGGFGWIGEGNHRVLAARQLGMTHLPVRVEFGAARDGKFIYDKNYSRVPTQVVTEQKIEQLKEQAGKYYHIKYASIWETNLPTNQEPSIVSKEQIDWQRSEFGRGQVNPAIVNRTTEVQQAAVDLLEGKITNKEYQDIVKFTQTIEAITRFFLPASTKDMKESLDSNKAKLLNTDIEDGTEIGLRLDIPAYKNKNIWIVSVHDKGKAGKSISYGSVAWATDVNFGSNPKVAAFIAAGVNTDVAKRLKTRVKKVDGKTTYDVVNTVNNKVLTNKPTIEEANKFIINAQKQDKTTIARMLGKWKNFEGKTKEERDAAAVKKVEEIVAIENKYPGSNRTGSPWRQIGMNPFRHSFFYDRRNGKPVVYASEVVQIGGLVYAKDVVYADKTDPMFEVEGYKDAEGETVRFQIDEKTNESFESRQSIGEKIFGSDIDNEVDNQVSQNGSWKSRPRTAFEKFVDLTRLRIQDKFRRLIIVQEDIEHSSGKPVGLDQDFRNAEALMHGKAKEELNKSEERVAKIAKLIKAAGIKIEKFNELLYAMHAQERNRYLRIASTDIGASLAKLRKKLKIKPSEIAEQLGITTQEYLDIEANKEVLTTDNLKHLLQIYGTSSSEFFYENAAVKDGSGMTDKEARTILAEYGMDVVDPESSQLPTKLRAAVEAVYDLTADTRQRLLDSGLETPETIEAFETTYKNYIPLRGFAEGDLDSEIIEGGRKLEVRGREKRAKGRKTKADDPLTQAVIANTTTIIRAEKNSVMNRFYNLAKNNPNQDVYKVIDPKIDKEYKTEDRGGKLRRTAKTVADYLLDPNVVAVRVDGDYKFIRFKDKRLADALRGANVVKADFMVKYLGQFNRMLSSFITTYDPEFVLRNFSRDIQTAVMNLYAEQEISEGLIKDKNIVAKVVKDTLPALRAIFAVEGGVTGKKKSSKNKEMDQYYREFKEDGAKTEWFYSKSSSEVQNDIENLIKGKGTNALQAAGNLVERINSSVENAVRLSTYVNARKAGVSRAKAAELAKGLTVNFNKSGEWGQIGNTLYLFFNASVQGTSRLIRALKPRYKVDSEGNRSLQVTTAQKMAIGLSILGSLLSVLNELSSDDDEDGESFYSKIADFEKERNIIIMKPNGKDYFKIPLPYGVNVFYVAGTLLADAAQKIKTPGEAAVGIMESALGSFSPINFPTSSDVPKFLAKFVTPTVGQIPLSLAINENYFGQTIYNQNFPFDTSPKPESELGRKGSNRWTQEFVKFMNKATGGSAFRPGAIDINPDKIDFVMESLSGGMGKFVGRSANIVDKVITGNWDELEPRQVPFLRVFYGQSPKYANVQDFYSRSVLVNQMYEEVKEKVITDPVSRRKISKMYYLGKNLRKQLRNIKEKEDLAMKIKDPELQQSRLEKLESTRYRLVANYNKQYTTFEIDKLK